LSRVESRPVPEKPGEFRPERPGSVPGVPFRYGLKRRRFDKQQTTSFSQYTGKQITLSSSRSQSQTHEFFPQSIPDFSQSQINPEIPCFRFINQKSLTCKAQFVILNPKISSISETLNQKSKSRRHNFFHTAAQFLPHGGTKSSVVLLPQISS
jgi:hypothetical protein